jgi:hypothetical protein
MSDSSIAFQPAIVVPQMTIRSPNVRPREFTIGDAKRLLQHRSQADKASPVADLTKAGNRRHDVYKTITPSDSFPEVTFVPGFDGANLSPAVTSRSNYCPIDWMV